MEINAYTFNSVPLYRGDRTVCPVFAFKSVEQFSYPSPDVQDIRARRALAQISPSSGALELCSLRVSQLTLSSQELRNEMGPIFNTDITKQM